MKIGDFSRRFGVSRDTVRYYIEMGILAPQKNGKNYAFTDTDLNDMSLILELKAYDLPVQTLATIMSMRRQLHSKDKRLDAIIADALENQRQKLSAEVDRLERILAAIDQGLAQHRRRSEHRPRPHGIPLHLTLSLRCPVCGSELRLTDTVIAHGLIQEAAMQCQCGHELAIRDGVLLADPGHRIAVSDDAGTARLAAYPWWDNHLGGTIEPLDIRGTRIVNAMNKSYRRLYQWLRESPIFVQAANPYLLNCGDNTGRFLLYYLSDLADGRAFLARATLIMVVSSPDVPGRIRDLIAAFDLDTEPVFIVTPPDHIPLAPASIDAHIDDTASFFHYARTGQFLPDTLAATGILKPTAETYGIITSDLIQMLRHSTAAGHTSSTLQAILQTRPTDGLTTEKIHLYNKFDKMPDQAAPFILYRLRGSKAPGASSDRCGSTTGIRPREGEG